MLAEVVVSSEPSGESCIVRIEVRVKVGDSLMAASDDPLFLGLRGPEGREFRLALAHGRSLRRGSDDRFVLGAPHAAETNVDKPELNDPGQPALHVDAVESAYLRKGFDPIPNVRAVGELDDRLEVIEAELEIHAEGRPKPLRFRRGGPIWLGLVAGLHLELARAPDEG
jgi:hypothetical protein